MAVEIKEVIIRAILHDEDEKQEEKSGSDAWGGGNKESAGTDEIIEMCVEQVLRILKRKNYR